MGVEGWGGSLAGFDCLIDRYLLLEKGRGGRGDGGPRMRCVFCRPQRQGALCVCGRMMDYMGATGLCVCLFGCLGVRVCGHPPPSPLPSSVMSLCKQRKHAE